MAVVRADGAKRLERDVLVDDKYRSELKLPDALLPGLK